MVVESRKAVPEPRDLPLALSQTLAYTARPQPLDQYQIKLLGDKDT